MSDISMALNTLGTKLDGKEANPGVLNTWLVHHHGYEDAYNYNWTSIERFGYRFEGIKYDVSQIKQDICAGKVVVANDPKLLHWVLAFGVDGNGDIRVNDPFYDYKVYKSESI